GKRLIVIKRFVDEGSAGWTRLRSEDRARLYERIPKHLQALRYRQIRRFFSFHFERHIAFESGVTKNLGDPIVIELAGVIDAAAVIGLGLNDDRVRRQAFELRIRIAYKIARIQIDAEPGRIDALVNAQQSIHAR